MEQGLVSFAIWDWQFETLPCRLVRSLFRVFSLPSREHRNQTRSVISNVGSDTILQNRLLIGCCWVSFLPPEELHAVLSICPVIFVPLFFVPLPSVRERGLVVTQTWDWQWNFSLLGLLAFQIGLLSISCRSAAQNTVAATIATARSFVL